MVTENVYDVSPADPDSYCQCIMVREGDKMRTIGWINTWAAAVGKRITLKDEDGIWIVEKVFAYEQSKEAIVEKQRKDRRSLTSIHQR